MNDDFKPPEETLDDVNYLLLKGGVGSIPIVGPMAAELINSILAPTLQKRLQHWRERIGVAVSEMMSRENIKIEELQNNELFISAITHASQIAVKTHNEEKLKLLKNAVLNISFSNELDESLSIVILQLVDTLTPSHVVMLKILDNPRVLNLPDKRNGMYVSPYSLREIVQHVEVGEKDKTDFNMFLVKDLMSKNIALNVDFNEGYFLPGGGVGSANEIYSFTTSLGKTLLRYIEDTDA